jgi:hypothetical protein
MQKQARGISTYIPLDAVGAQGLSGASEEPLKSKEGLTYGMYANEPSLTRDRI